MALETIVANKKIEVKKRKNIRPLHDFKDDLEVSSRSLFNALKKKHTGFIFECKKASPSRGLIRKDFDPVQIAKTYSKYADAISVLADEKFFSGSLEYVRAVHDAVDIPVLCKDFILDTYQVYEARYYGADAVLLMLSVLKDNDYKECSIVAKSLGLDVLTEVHDEKELKRALKLDAKIIGINNRNLKTLKVDIEVSKKLLPLIPKDKVIVSESGISTHKDVCYLRDDCDAFLVGSSLMSKPVIDIACRALVYGEVKVCGLTRAEDAKAAFDAGAIYGGLIFVEKSPRNVSIEKAKKVKSAAPMNWVGVFVNEDIEKVVSIAKGLKLSAVQLHGDETLEYIGSVKSKLPLDCEVWKAYSVGDVYPNIEGTGASRVLLDTASKKARGGTGKQFDWTLLEDKNLENVALAGGLNVNNAKKADSYNPRALDVNSGVEDSPGIKNKKLINNFFKNLRG